MGLAPPPPPACLANLPLTISATDPSHFQEYAGLTPGEAFLNFLRQKEGTVDASGGEGISKQ